MVVAYPLQKTLILQQRRTNQRYVTWKIQRPFQVWLQKAVQISSVSPLSPCSRYAQKLHDLSQHSALTPQHEEQNPSFCLAFFCMLQFIHACLACLHFQDPYAEAQHLTAVHIFWHTQYLLILQAWPVSAHSSWQQLSWFLITEAFLEMLTKLKDQEQNFRSSQRIRNALLFSHKVASCISRLWSLLGLSSLKTINLSCCPFSQARNKIFLWHYWLIMKIVLLHFSISSWLFFMQIELSLSSSVTTIFVFPLTKSVRNSFVIANDWSFFFQKNMKPIANYFYVSQFSIS